MSEKTKINSSGNDLQVKLLEKELYDLKHEIIKLRLVLKNNGLDGEEKTISDEEAICVKQIERIKELSSERLLVPDEVKMLDILHKNLKLSRGESAKSKKKANMDKMSSAELLKFIGSEK